MKYGISFTLAAAVLASGCNLLIPAQPPKTGTGDGTKAIGGAKSGTAAIESKLSAGVQKPITYKTREEKVEVMAKAFSVSNNKGLGTAADSFKALATSLQSAFSAGASLTSPSVPTTPKQRASDLARMLRVQSSKTAYTIAGLAEFKQGEATFIYDEDTKELTAIKGPDAEIRFKFENKGNTRGWEATIVKSPDGTTGTFSVEVTSSTWKPYSFPTPTAPWSCAPYSPKPKSSPYYYGSPPPTYYPTYEPTYYPTSSPTAEPTEDVDASGGGQIIAVGGGNYHVSQAYPRPGYTPDPNYEYGGEYDDGYYDDYGYDDERCGPDPNWVAPTPIPFKFSANEYPEFVDKVSFKFVVKPKGDDKLAFEMSGAADDPENVPNSSARIPTHWTYMARIPGVYFDWESQLELRPGNSTFDAKGKMLVEVDAGQEAFTYTLGLKEAQRTGTFALTNVGAKMQLLITGDQGPYGSPSIHTRLLSTEDGSEVGTVEMKQGSYNVAVVRFKDGTTKDYELFPLGLIPQGPTPTAAYPAPEPTYYE